VEQREPAAVYTKAALVTVDDVIAFGSGPGTAELRGVLDNTKIFEIIRDAL
jgi:alkaline phosphatase